MIWGKCQALACSMPAKTHDEETKEERRRGEEEKRRAREDSESKKYYHRRLTHIQSMVPQNVKSPHKARWGVKDLKLRRAKSQPSRGI